jgi:hypothetical protein
MKVAVMGCIVNGPGEAEGADVAVFAGDRRGIIYVQGERVANVPEAEILQRLLAECLAFQARCGRGPGQAGREEGGDHPARPRSVNWEVDGRRWQPGQVQAKPATLTIGKSS